jgi:Protein of unknown function (DUF2817)
MPGRLAATPSNPEAYFPADYRQGRRAFIDACEGAGIDAITRVHPNAKGPDGKPLFIDSAALGPRTAKKGLLLISGTHGVEGYFGSGVLTGLLRQGVSPPPDTRLVLVHALNPYGFAWNRRVNEDNVDLNRNFIDYAQPPDNQDYTDLAGDIASFDGSPEAIARADARLAAYAAEHGEVALQTAFSRGQYVFPKGLFFGGTAPSWSLRMLQSILTEDLSRVKKLVTIDFHTGLGEAGAAELIVEHLPDSAAYARAKAMWGPLVASDRVGESLSVAVTGTLDQAVAAWLPKVELTYGVLEVGTASLPQILDALRMDNWLHNFAPDQRLAPKITQACRDAFYPDQPEWKRMVFGHGLKAVNAALGGLQAAL